MRSTLAIATLVLSGAVAVGAGALGLQGSDTLGPVTIDLLNLTTADCGGVAQGLGFGTLAYEGGGSDRGQASMLAGQQQIAPMSRAFDGSTGLCKAPLFGPSGTPTQETTEAFVFALDGLGVTANAANFGACNGLAHSTCVERPSLGLVSSKAIVPYSTRTCSVDSDCNTAGVVGETCASGVCTYVIPTWKEPLQFLFAGMSVPSSDSVHRADLSLRNCASPERKFLAANWNQLFQSCQSTSCPSGIEHAFRPSD